MVIKTQKESVEFLTNAGFKVSTSQFNRDVLAGKVARTPDGYEEGALLAYAAALALVLRGWARFQESVFPVWRWMVAFCASACMFVWVYLGTILAEGVLWQGIWYEVGRQGRVIRMRRQK